MLSMWEKKTFKLIELQPGSSTAAVCHCPDTKRFVKDKAIHRLFLFLLQENKVMLYSSVLGCSEIFEILDYLLIITYIYNLPVYI